MKLNCFLVAILLVAVTTNPIIGQRIKTKSLPSSTGRNEILAKAVSNETEFGTQTFIEASVAPIVVSENPNCAASK